MTDLYSGNPEAAAEPQGASAIGAGAGNSLSPLTPRPQETGSQPTGEAKGKGAGTYGLGRVKHLSPRPPGAGQGRGVGGKRDGLMTMTQWLGEWGFLISVSALLILRS